MQVVDTLDFLRGKWSLERFLTDHLSRTSGRFEGSAAVVNRPSGTNGGSRVQARYDEAGTLRFGHHMGPARRSLEFVRQESSVVMMYFTDGQPYVDLDLRSGTWRSLHPCAEDHYEIVTVVRSPDEVEERWRVRGPAKDYEAVTMLRRLDRPQEIDTYPLLERTAL
jgi:hypothetical protein